MKTNRKLRIPFSIIVLALVLLGVVRQASAQKEGAADVVAEVVVSDLDAPVDFSVTADGEVVFIAEQGAQRIRRVQGDANEIVVSEIESADQLAESIAVHAVNSHRVLLGLSGFSSAKQALCLFDMSAQELPLDFNDDQVEHSKSFERILKRKELSVLQMFPEQRGLTMVCKSGDAPPTMFDIHFKGGNLDRLSEHKFEASTADLSTLAVDQMGGYYAAVPRDNPKQIMFYRAENTLTQSFPTELENIVSMSFSPIHNRLFALVGNASKNALGDSGGDGIYEILADGDGCKSQFVIAIDGAQKLKFDAQGNAWILCIADADSRKGLLKKVSGLDVSPAVLAASADKSESESDAN